MSHEGQTPTEPPPFIIPPDFPPDYPIPPNHEPGKMPSADQMFAMSRAADEEFFEFIAQMMVGSQGHNIPDALMELKGSLDRIRESIDINSKCQLKLVKELKSESGAEPKND